MSDEHNPTYAELYHRHHWLYAPENDDGGLIETIHIGTGIEVGPGWLPLLDRALTQIGQEVRALPGQKRNDFAITQIKEKFGALCIYLRGGNRRIDRIAGAAEALSERVCEECGAYGFSHVFDTTWYWTLCGVCAQERARKSNMPVEVYRQHAENN